MPSGRLPALGGFDIAVETHSHLRWARALDVGTGSGFLALHMALKGEVVATDVSPFAVRTAKRNAEVNGLKVDIVQCDLFEGLRGVFDIIAFNPPYLPVHENHS